MQNILRFFPTKGLPGRDEIQDPQLLAENLFDEAEAYWRSAVELEKADIQARGALQPVRNLYHHAIALYLKAFLSLEGIPMSDLEGKFKNDFRRIRKHCEKGGLHFEKPHDETIDYFVRTPLPLRLKYAPTEFYSVPTVRALDDFCQMLRNRVGERVRPVSLA